VALNCAILLCVARQASAQSQSGERLYVTVSGLVDVKRFSVDGGSSVLDGTTGGLSVAGGVRLAPRWDVELNLDLPASTTDSEFRGLAIGRTMVQLELKTRNRALTTAALVRFRGAQHGRLQLGYIAGLSIIRFERRFEVTAPGVPASLIPRSRDAVDYRAAPTIGVDVELTLTRHLSIVPGFHASVFSLQETSALLLRPRGGVRWTF
jgi:hypothetical protein